MRGTHRARFWIVLACALVAGASGCVHFDRTPAIPDVPNERQKSLLDEYVIESPDLLQIDLLYAVPLPPYKIQPLDVLLIAATGLPESDQIAGLYPVEPDGVVNFGGRAKSVKVVGMTLSDAKTAIQKHLEAVFPNAKVVTVSVAEGRGVQLIRGQHLVRPDGSVSLGSYGSVVVAGHTLRDAKALIEEHLKKFLQSPEVVVNVIGYNSKVYYVIFDFGGAGQQVIRLPVTGNDTVLDAISQVNGLTAVSDPRNVWVARSSGLGEADQILPVDWYGLTCRGRAESNYQLLPNDRIFVKAYRLTTVDVALARLLSPFERALGITLLGSTTYNATLNAGVRSVGGGVGGGGVGGGFR